MFSSLVVTTVYLPFALGLMLAFSLGRGAGHRFGLLAVLVAVMVAYLALEGLPALPPVSAKQKIPFLFAAVAACLALAKPLRIPLSAVVGAFLILGSIWIGINKLSAEGGLISSLFVLAPIVTATVASQKLTIDAAPGLVWSITLLCVALGAAGLSALGTFVGFAQVAGAFAALIGAYVLVRYVLLLTGREAALAALPALAVAFLIVALVSVLVLIGLLAPAINKPAFVVLSLGLLAPVVLPGLGGTPAPVRPILHGVLAAVPTIAAVALAL